MISTPLLVCLIGLTISLIFTKWQKVADSWVARMGELSFFAGLLVWLFNVQGKSIF